MNNLQFRCWDKERKIMLYDDFVIRNGNFMSKEIWYTLCNGVLGEPYPAEDGRPDNQGAVFLEGPPDAETANKIAELMGDPCGCYELIDFSNFYELNNLIVMQSTGMRDRSNKIIWEGDLIKFGNIVDVVCWYYCCYQWNGQMLADFRDFDELGCEIKYEPTPININGYDGVMALGHQGDVFGLQTCNVEIVGNIYEHGTQYGFTEDTIKAFCPKY